ncbi:MAG: hypothetical protein IPF68_00615 [Bacteroidales bacterium]|nr:hypothetical protein [Bacteroidales bacterium]
MLFILVIDPYNFFGVFHVINDKDKFTIIQRTDESSPRGNILWKTIKFRRNPVSKVIIGDSQGKDINVDLIRDITGEEYLISAFPEPVSIRCLRHSGSQPDILGLRKFIFRLHL